MTIEELYNIFTKHKHQGYALDNSENLVLKGTTAPDFRPTRVGLMYIDTLNGQVYVSTNTSSDSDWKLLND